jgi:hypothetical protein
LTYSDEEIDEKLDYSFTQTASQGILDWFLGGSQMMKDPRMHYSLYVIEKKGSVWGPTRFLSDFVTTRFTKWIAALLAGQMTVDRQKNLLFYSNPVTAGLVRLSFENWAFEALGLQRRNRVVHIMDLSSKTEGSTERGRPEKFLISPANDPPVTHVGSGSEFRFFRMVKTGRFQES